MSETEIILRLARGAQELDYTLNDFIEALEAYTKDKSALDRQPLLAWFNFGG